MHAVMSSSLQPHGLQPTSPWDSPGKNTGAGCHFLPQGIFLTRVESGSLCLLQVDSLPLVPPKKHLSKDIIKRIKKQATGERHLHFHPKKSNCTQTAHWQGKDNSPTKQWATWQALRRRDPSGCETDFSAAGKCRSKLDGTLPLSHKCPAAQHTTHSSFPREETGCWATSLSLLLFSR